MPTVPVLARMRGYQAAWLGRDAVVGTTVRRSVSELIAAHGNALTQPRQRARA